MCFKGCISGRVVKSSLWREATLATTSGLLPGATFNDVCYNTFQIIHSWAWVLYFSPWYAFVGWEPMKAWESMMRKDGIPRVYVVHKTDIFLEREIPRHKNRWCIPCTQLRSNIVSQKSNKWSVHKLGVTLCVNTTQLEHCVSTHGRYRVQIC